MVPVVLQVTEEHWTRAANLSSNASPIGSDFAEILTLWNKLDESARRDLLEKSWGQSPSFQDSPNPKTRLEMKQSRSVASI